MQTGHNIFHSIMLAINHTDTKNISNKNYGSRFDIIYVMNNFVMKL
jgi:hypothetical protein